MPLIAWFVSGLMFLGGIVAGFFIGREDMNFEIVQMMAAIGLFTLLAAILAFAPQIKKRIQKKKDGEAGGNGAGGED